MKKLLKSVSKTAGLPPGTPIHIGEKKAEAVKITVINYDKDHIDTFVVQAVEECFAYKETSTVTWINVDGLHDTDVIEQLGKHYGLHSLVIEDILNTQQRAKFEIVDNYLVMVLKMHSTDEVQDTMDIEQVSVILGQDFVLTFQEKEGDVFEPVRQRLANDKGQIRKTGADYLAYSLIDAVVDGYFSVVEHLGDQIEFVEDELLSGKQTDILQKIHLLKREVIMFRRSVWPFRNMIGDLERRQTPLIQPSTAIYLRDIYDHILQVGDTIEIFRDTLTSLLDVHLSSASNKMNEIMKFLTIIGTIFIPLTFIAGIYGMNFHYMPELTWRWGYFAILLVMVGIGIGLVFYFKRKRWL